MTHARLTEPSLRIHTRKGREGKGTGREERHSPSIRNWWGDSLLGKSRAVSAGDGRASRSQR